MSDIAIRVENLGKRYRIGKAAQHSNGRNRLAQIASAPFRYLTTTLREPAPDEIFWALKDVSFEVKQGEDVGIIGRNGAGKSTLLKILSRIMEPTEGSVDMYGRVGSLLEVGTGFHPDLTGRENIYLSGTILGMKKWEIDRKFDEIVAFAEIDKFIDTPVKRYSSGMYVRLAFGVAAHLETEILLVDEVLAVGDAAFQKKCQEKIGDVAKEGRTVLFVSHNMNAVQRLCERVILIDSGRIHSDGHSKQVVDRYFAELERSDHGGPIIFDGSPFKTLGFQIDGQSAGDIVSWEYMSPLKVSVFVDCANPEPVPRVDIAFYRLDGLKLFAIQSDRVLDHIPQKKSNWQIDFVISGVSIEPQRLFFDLGLRKDPHGNYLVLWKHACEILTETRNFDGHVTDDSVLLPEVRVNVGS